MKVAHREDYDTHAVIGGKQIEEFEIAQTAEFFTVLSDTMYTNKPLAVAREVLCNAWDAHIVSGCTDRAVAVTITDDKLTFRDYGFGIPHNLIHKIYCVYGSSTKENDGNQTGGFGLGSKSPFSYSDHFTVSNHHDGLNTVHAISKGSALTKGKPDRRVMVTVPSTQTGVEVMIPLKKLGDRRVFEGYIRDVAAFGEMNVTINGEPVKKVPISKAEGNMFLTRQQAGVSINKINVRYGNVMYPITPDAQYIGVYNKLFEMLMAIPAMHGGKHDKNDFYLIMQAPPNSISVTPSRESLSLTETTVKTVTRLMTEVIEYFGTSSTKFREKLLHEQHRAIQHMWMGGYAERILTSKNLLADEHGPGSVADEIKNQYSEVTNLTELANYYLKYQKDLGPALDKMLWQQRLRAMIEAGWRRPNDLKTLLYLTKQIKRRKITRKGRYGPFDEPDGMIYNREVIRPIIKQTYKNPLLNAKHLWVASEADGGRSRIAWAKASTWMGEGKRLQQLAQGIVIITHSRNAYEQDFENVMPEYDDHVSALQTHLVYVAPRTKGTKEAAVEHFQQLGFHVIDLASAVDEYRFKAPVYRDPSEKLPAIKKPKPVGLPAMSNLIGQLESTKHRTAELYFRNMGHTTEGAIRTDKYDYVIKPHNLAGNRGHSVRFFPWGDNYAVDIVRLFGDNIGICVSDPQLQSQLGKGKKLAIPWIVDQIVQKVLTSASIRTYVENSAGENVSHSNHFSRVLGMAQYSKVIRDAIGFPINHDPDDVIYYNLFLHLHQNSHGHGSPGGWEKSVQAAYDVTQKWTAPQRYIDLAQKLKDAHSFTMLDLYDMEIELQRMATSKKVNIRLKTFIEMTILNAINV